MNHKRHQPRSQVRCRICTPNRDGELKPADKRQIERAVKMVVEEYGDTLRMLGKD